MAKTKASSDLSFIKGRRLGESCEFDRQVLASLLAILFDRIHRISNPRKL